MSGVQGREAGNGVVVEDVGEEEIRELEWEGDDEACTREL